MKTSLNILEIAADLCGIRCQPQGLLELNARLSICVHERENQSIAVPGLDVIRIRRYRLLEVPGSLPIVMSLGQKISQIVVGFGKIRLKIDRVSKG